jgi:hypothetical protein
LIPSTTDAVSAASGIPISYVTRLFIAAYFIDTGLLLVAAPWTMWWQQNFFAELSPWLAAFMTTTVCQMWVIATGAVTTLAGVIDVYGLVTSRHRGSGGRSTFP